MCCARGIFGLIFGQLSNFTHSVAVHEEDTKGLPTLVFKAEKERIMSVEVVGSLQGHRETDGGYSELENLTITVILSLRQTFAVAEALTPFGKPSLLKMGQVLQLVSWRYCL